MTEATTTMEPSDIIDITKRLADILRQEAQMIKEMKLSKLHTLQEEKLNLTSILESYKNVLKDNPHIVRSIPKNTLGEMKDIAKDFETVVAEDAIQIQKARKVHGIVMEALKNAVLKQNSISKGYNKSGEIDYGKKKMFQSQPFSINESI